MSYTEIIMVVDRSADMAALEADIIAELNTWVATQQAYIGGTDAKVTLVMFDDLFEFVWYRVPLADLPTLTNSAFYSRGRIAIKDAIGRSIIEVYNKLETLNYAEKPDNVIAMIMSFGVDTQSLTFRVDGNLENRVDFQRLTHSWEFKYLGTNQVSAVEAARYGVPGADASDFTNDGAGVIDAINGVGGNSFVTASHDARGVPSIDTTIDTTTPADIVIDNVGFTVNVADGMDVGTLTATLSAVDGSTQTYGVTDAGGVAKVAADPIVTTDILVVTAENTVTTDDFDLTTNSVVTDIVEIAPGTYTIDNAGLTIRLPAATTVAVLTAALVSTDGSVQAYSVTDVGGVPRDPADVIVSTDILVSVCELTTYSAGYAMTIYSDVTTIDTTNPLEYVVDNVGFEVYVIAATSVDDLVTTLFSTDGTTQTYAVRDNVGALKAGADIIVTTDIINVEAENGVDDQDYALSVFSNATDIVSIDPTYIVDLLLLEVLAPAVGDVAALIAALDSADGSVQGYVVTDAMGAPKAGADPVAVGDILEVTAENGSNLEHYDIDFTSNVTDIVSTHPDEYIIDNLAGTIVATPSTVGHFIATLTATDGSGQQYGVEDSFGAPKAAGDPLADLDVLNVTAEDTVTIVPYTITVLSHITDIVPGIGILDYYTDNVAVWVRVPVAATVADLTGGVNVVAVDASVQGYTVTDHMGVPKGGGDVLVAGDIFIVVAENTVGFVHYDVQITSDITDIESSLPDQYLIDNIGIDIVATPSTVGDLLVTLAATDGSIQVYELQDHLGAAKGAGEALVTGDQLYVVAENTIANDTYPVTVLSHVTDIDTTDIAVIIDNGLLTVDVPTGYQVVGLTLNLVATDASAQLYAVTDSLGAPKNPVDSLVTGDILEVTAENTVGVANYTITLV